MLDWVAKNWEQPDQGIWEVRGGRRDFTYSKLQCWVALDRGLRLAAKRSLPVFEKSWAAERDRIYRTIMERSWNPEIGAFTQYFGADAMDASSLMMPLMRFISPDRSAHDFDHPPGAPRTDVGQPGAPVPDRQGGATTASLAAKATSPYADSGWWRPWRAPVARRMRNCFSKSCSPSPIIWDCFRKRSVPGRTARKLSAGPDAPGPHQRRL